MKCERIDSKWGSFLIRLLFIDILFVFFLILIAPSAIVLRPGLWQLKRLCYSLFTIVLNFYLCIILHAQSYRIIRLLKYSLILYIFYGLLFIAGFSYYLNLL